MNHYMDLTSINSLTNRSLGSAFIIQKPSDRVLHQEKGDFDFRKHKAVVLKPITWILPTQYNSEKCKL